MGYKLKYEHPHFPPDYEVAISTLGRVRNGGELEVSEDAERRFVAARGMTLEDALGDTAGLTVSGSSTIDKKELEQLIPPAQEEEATPQSTPTWTKKEVVSEGEGENA